MKDIGHRNMDARFQSLVRTARNIKLDKLYKTIKMWGKEQGYVMPKTLEVVFQYFYDNVIKKEIKDEN